VREDLVKLSELSVGYFHSDEGREGVRAFREKRPASWVPRH
jgi:methylglutaconyl-CoA hydratase